MPDGFHVATRKTNPTTRYKGIVSIVEIGTNIGATADTYPYFMHCFTEGGAIDSGILYKNKQWLLYAFGTIAEPDQWKQKVCSGFKAGDTVQITSRVAASGNTLIVEAKKVGSSVNNVLNVNLSANRASSLRTSGSIVAREMNLASHLSNLNGEDAFFSWSKFKESTVTNVANVSSKMTTSNSWLATPNYDSPSVNHDWVGYSVNTPTTVNGYVVDRAWGRCNQNKPPGKGGGWQ